VTEYVLKCEGFATGPSPYDGSYLEWSNPNAPMGSNFGGWTPDLRKAKRFASPAAALECWREQRTIDHQVRPDGKPNRPLTAFTVSVSPIGQKE
jgi:hypothetical protein